MTGKRRNRYFHGKLLLFGEYGVVIGGKALTVPFTRHGAQLTKNGVEEYGHSTQALRDFYFFLTSIEEVTSALDMERFSRDLTKGLFFDSDIPQKYGVGSSGALVAAVYKEYAYDPPQRTAESLSMYGQKLKGLFSVMESHFHGKSSGLDPLCSFFNTPLLVTPDQNILPAFIPESDPATTLTLFLVDTGVSAETAPLVNLFLQQMKDPQFAKKTEKGYLPITDKILANLQRSGLSYDLMEPLHSLSSLQYTLFFEMIPDRLRPFWQRGLHYGEYLLKLLGSGGGGYLLGFTRDAEVTFSLFKNNGFEIIPIALSPESLHREINNDLETP